MVQLEVFLYQKASSGQRIIFFVLHYNFYITIYSSLNHPSYNDADLLIICRTPATLDMPLTQFLCLSLLV